MTYFEQAGGEEAVRAILRDFYDRVFADVMIGYLFAQSDRERLVELEYQLTARHLGADVQYTGRSMAEAHGAHRILAGHFERRFRLLEVVLDEHGLPMEVRDEWLNHTRSLRRAVLGSSADHDGCDRPQPGSKGGVSEH